MAGFEKLHNFQKQLQKDGVEAAIVTSSNNLFYLTDFFAAAAMLVTPEESWYFTDFRTIEDGERHFADSGIHLEMSVGSFIPYIRKVLEEQGIRKVSLENRTMTVAQAESWKAGLGDVQIGWLGGTLEALRQVKFPRELECTIRAQRIVEQSLRELLPLIKPGVSEKELVAELIYRFYRNGAEGLAFPVIILSGPNTSLPHGFPGDRKIQAGDFITMDIGVKVGGYCSDMTRTFALGYATEEMKKVYATVLEAQLAGIAAIAPGKVGSEVDAAARSIIDGSEFAGTFGHGLGHSVGLVCHDGLNAGKNSTDVFSVGNIITMEPGIYLKGQFGVRIEDMVYLSENGTINLTEFPKELTILPAE